MRLPELKTKTHNFKLAGAEIEFKELTLQEYNYLAMLDRYSEQLDFQSKRTNDMNISEQDRQSAEVKYSEIDQKIFDTVVDILASSMTNVDQTFEERRQWLKSLSPHAATNFIGILAQLRQIDYTDVKSDTETKKKR